jgi:hypothetical protein
MMKEVLQHCPALARFVWYLYGAPSRLWISGARPDEPPVLSCARVRQGDPLGPLLFALVLQPILEHLSKYHAHCHQAADADEVVLQGTPVALADAFSVLKARCANVGLQVNAEKCNVYSRSHSAAQSVAASLSVKHATRGIVVAGTRLSTDDFIQEYAASTAEDAQCAVQKLLTLPMPAQCQWAVLQGSQQRRVAHLPRVARWAEVENALTDTTNAVADAALKIGQCQVQPGSAADGVARAQLELPMRHAAWGSIASHLRRALQPSSPRQPSRTWPWRRPLSNSGLSRALPAWGCGKNGRRCENTLVLPTPPAIRWMEYACARCCHRHRRTLHVPRPHVACARSLIFTNRAAH